MTPENVAKIIKSIGKGKDITQKYFWHTDPDCPGLQKNNEMTTRERLVVCTCERLLMRNEQANVPLVVFFVSRGEFLDHEVDATPLVVLYSFDEPDPYDAYSGTMSVGTAYPGPLPPPWSQNKPRDHMRLIRNSPLTAE